VTNPTADDLLGPGLGETQRGILDRLKRRGASAVREIGADLDLAAETVREHLNSLTARGLVRRAGSRKDGPGRPEILYALTETGESLFPQREGRLLGELTRYLIESGGRDVLEAFFERRLADLREEARARIEGLEGRERLEAVAAILTEQGFMAEIVDGGGAPPRLKLCHCPLAEMVAISTLPCRAEIALVKELIDEPLERLAWMPDGDRTCTYVIGGSAEEVEASEPSPERTGG